MERNRQGDVRDSPCCASVDEFVWEEVRSVIEAVARGEAARLARDEGRGRRDERRSDACPGARAYWAASVYLVSWKVAVPPSFATTL